MRRHSNGKVSIRSHSTKPPSVPLIVSAMKKSEALHILGLNDGATDEEIKKAHRKKVVANHPDQYAKDPSKKAQAEEQTKLINEARDVLLSRKWDPEYGPRGTGYSQAPYTYTTSRPANEDPRYDEWPFNVDFDYIWTSWENGTQATGKHAAGGQGQQGRPAGSNPFDPFGGYSSYTQAPQKTPEEEMAEAKQDLTIEIVGIAAKLACLGVCMATASWGRALYLYVLLSVALGIFKHMRGMGILSWFMLLPLVMVCFPLVIFAMPNEGQMVGGAMIIFFGMAVMFDVSNIRSATQRWRTAKTKCKVS